MLRIISKIENSLERKNPTRKSQEDKHRQLNKPKINLRKMIIKLMNKRV